MEGGGADGEGWGPRGKGVGQTVRGGGRVGRGTATATCRHVALITGCCTTVLPSVPSHARGSVSGAIRPSPTRPPSGPWPLLGLPRSRPPCQVHPVTPCVTLRMQP